jgi:hypothetical protein
LSGGLSAKLVLVLAAFAFVIGFRVHAGSDDTPARTATTLSPAGASALASDTSVQPAARGISAPALAGVAALPALHRAPPRPPKKAQTVSATPSATAVPTVAPTAAPAPVAPAKPKAKSYVGKSFDSKG